MTELRAVHLRCEHLVSPLGLDPDETPHPRLSWGLEADENDQRQTAYQICVRCAGAITWDSGKVPSDETLNIPYGGTSRHAPALRWGTRYEWSVRVWDRTGAPSEWSVPACWGTRPAWSAHWIGEQSNTPWRELEARPSPLLRKAFLLTKPVRQAVLHASALGLYEARLNGQRVGDQQLAPEWTDYRSRVQYQSYDVTSLVKKGRNAVGLMLAPGWYAGRLGLGSWAPGGGERGFYGRWPRGFLQMNVIFKDGSEATIESDASWRYTLEGPIRASDLFDGETFDARCEPAGWDRPGFKDSRWLPVETCKGPPLVPQRNEPIRITQRMTPKMLTEPQPGVFIFDVGQNLTGWIRLRIRRTRSGRAIRLRHGEILADDGSLYIENLRNAKQIDTYICRGGGEEQFEPRFTYHGFRYVEITGLGYPPELEDVEACVVHSAAPEAGAFECSDPLLNRIMTAIQWTQRGNLHGIPTDCPQRDERLGWMGDIQVFAQTAIFNMDMAAFFTKWSQDVRDAQRGDGCFPDFAPMPFNPDAPFYGAPAWADAGVLVLWRQWVNYADRALLAEHYESAHRWVDYLWRHNPDGLWQNKHGRAYGDWLNGDTLIMEGWPKTGGKVDIDVFATAFMAESTRRTADMAQVLGFSVDAERYRQMAAKCRTAFKRVFVDRTGRIKGDTQAGYALALHFALLPSRLEKKALAHLLRAIRRYGGRPSAGIQSTLRMLLVLVRQGQTELAYRMVQQRTPPSLGYMVEHGGTTIWERWDGWIEGRGPYHPGMNSFNHYALGATGEWMYRVIGGLEPDETMPGWKHFFIRPRPGGKLKWARVEYASIRGLIRSEWRLNGGALTLDVTIPPNTTATVQLPGQRTAHRVGPGQHRLTTAHLEAGV